MTLVKTCLSIALSGLLVNSTALLAMDPPEKPADQTAKTSKDKKDAKPKWDVNNPPGEEKTIKISTSESTWSNVDVSPDGKTVVFDMLGDI